MSRLVFIGISGYEYPHTRVRCYNFARYLADHFPMKTSVLSFKDHLGKKFSEVDMWGLSEKNKIKLTVKALIRLLRNSKDTFYVQKLHYHSGAPLLLNRIGRNEYIFDYDDYDVELTVPFKSARLNRLLLGSGDALEMVRYAAGNAEMCVGASHFLVDFLKQFNNRVIYVPTGVDTEKFPFVDRSGRTGPITILWNGVIWGEEILKSALICLKAFRRCRGKIPSARLKIVGSGQYFNRFEDALRQDFKDIADGVDITSWVTPDRMPEVLAGADIGLLPLADPSRWVQSKSPTKLFEYMSTGMPVMAFNNGEVRHVIENEISGFLAEDEDSYGDYLTRLAEDPDLRARIGQNARRRIENQFSLHHICERLYWALHRN